MSPDARATAAALLFAALGLVLLARCNPVGAETYSPMKAVTQAKKRQLFPPWADVTDSYRLVPTPDRMFLCITDRQTGDRWTTWSSATSWVAWVKTGVWEFSAWVETTAADRAVCWGA